MLREAICLLPSLAWAAMQPAGVLSPSGNRTAHVEPCPQVNCAPSVVVLDRDGHRVQSFQPRVESATPPSACGSILSIAWVGEDSIAAECHINPSLSEYIETDLATGHNTRDLLGGDFIPSPDGRLVAHAGWIVHFAPPYAQSNYLQIDHTTIYPLPKGVKPVVQAFLVNPPKVVYQEGRTYFGIHEFQHGLVWSPDSRRIALIDCTYAWTPRHPATLYGGDGRESGRRCALAVVSTGGDVARFPLGDVPPGQFRDARMSWIDLHRLLLQVGGLTRRYRVP